MSGSVRVESDNLESRITDVDGLEEDVVVVVDDQLVSIPAGYRAVQQVGTVATDGGEFFDDASSDDSDSPSWPLDATGTAIAGFGTLVFGVPLAFLASMSTASIVLALLGSLLVGGSLTLARREGRTTGATQEVAA